MSEKVIAVSAVRIIEWWKSRATQLRVETYALYLAYKDPRVPWHAKIFAACVVGYAFSPIDLIPDFIPILGYLDDLLLVPLGVALALKMIPPAVLVECREEAARDLSRDRPRNWMAAGVVMAVWVLSIALIAGLVLRAISG